MKLKKTLLITEKEKKTLSDALSIMQEIEKELNNPIFDKSLATLLNIINNQSEYAEIKVENTEECWWKFLMIDKVGNVEIQRLWGTKRHIEDYVYNEANNIDWTIPEEEQTDYKVGCINDVFTVFKDELKSTYDNNVYVAFKEDQYNEELEL